MPSLVPGYEYDIFISYRQKDNKHDGWVTEFLENLKGELESTFKEEISVYFDINPHDGLLETHDVDESLKNKLKCLVFIPIISRTYCDPKSFAWEHEFMTFVDLASKDQFGLKVKLPNGNVSSRVLPVQIHDLDKEDISLCESVIGSVLRGIEFIYKSAGVNRPLLPKEENPQDNLNHTNYRDQINKVANAIKEIISAIQHFNPQQDEITQDGSKSLTTPQKSKKIPIIITSVVAFALIVLGIIFIPKLVKPSEELEKSIAVLPFRNDSPDQEMYFINGVMEEILDNLCKIEDLRVVSRSSVEQYRAEPKPIPVVAEEMDVSYVLEGSGQRDGDNIRLTVQLLDAKKDQHIWSESYYREIKNIFELQSEIAQAIGSELRAIISPVEKQLIENIPTENLDAYYAYLRGKNEYSTYLLNRSVTTQLRLNSPDNDALNRAEDLYHQALEYDPEYAQAYAGLATVYWDKHHGEEYFSENSMDSVLSLANKAISYNNNLAEAYSLRGDYYRENADYDKAIKEYEKTLDINPNYWQAYYGLSLLYQYLRDPINLMENSAKALKLNHDPKERRFLLNILAFSYGQGFGFYDKAIEYYKDALKLDNDSLRFYGAAATIKSHNEEYSESIRLTKRRLELNPGNNNYNLSMGGYYYELGQEETAADWYKKYISGLDTLETSVLLNQMHRVGFAYLVAGQKEKAEEYFELQKKYCEESIKLNTPYAQGFTAYYDLACIYAIRGDTKNAYKNLHIYNDKIGDIEYNVMIWYFKTDPLLESIRNEPEFQEIYHEIETKYNNTHELVRKWLEEMHML